MYVLDIVILLAEKKTKKKMLRLLKNVQLSRYLSTVAKVQPERNPAILYTGVSIVFYRVSYLHLEGHM